MVSASGTCAGCGELASWDYCDSCVDFMKRVVGARAARVEIAQESNPPVNQPAVMFPASDGVRIRPTRSKAGAERRRTIWERDGRKCYWCMAKLPFSLATADHLVPRSHGGTHAIDNLVCACKACNGKRGNMELIEWVAAIGHKAPLVYERTVTERLVIAPPPAKKKRASPQKSNRAGLRFRGKGVMTPAEKLDLMRSRGLEFVN